MEEGCEDFVSVEAFEILIKERPLLRGTQEGTKRKEGCGLREEGQ